MPSLALKVVLAKADPVRVALAKADREVASVVPEAVAQEVPVAPTAKVKVARDSASKLRNPN